MKLNILCHVDPKASTVLVSSKIKDPKPGENPNHSVISATLRSTSRTPPESASRKSLHALLAPSIARLTARKGLVGQEKLLAVLNQKLQLNQLPF